MICDHPALGLVTYLGSLAHGAPSCRIFLVHRPTGGAVARLITLGHALATDTVISVTRRGEPPLSHHIWSATIGPRSALWDAPMREALDLAALISLDHLSMLSGPHQEPERATVSPLPVARNAQPPDPTLGDIAGSLADLIDLAEAKGMAETNNCPSSSAPAATFPAPSPGPDGPSCDALPALGLLPCGCSRQRRTSGATTTAERFRGTVSRPSRLRW